MLKKLFIFIAVSGMVFIFSQSASAKLTDLIPQNAGPGITITGEGRDKVARPSAVPKGFASVKNVVTLIFNTIITISGVIFLIMLLIGGIQYLTGAGNEETTGKAKKMMIDAIVGLIIVLASWAIGVWILGRLGGTATTTAPASTPGSTPTTTPPPSSTPSSTPTTSPTIIFQNTYTNPTLDIMIEQTEKCNLMDGEISTKTNASQTTIICTSKS